MAYLFDSHTHSNHSHDAHSTILELAETAVQKGLSGFCVTNHCDGDQWNLRDFYDQQATGKQEYLLAKEKYKGVLDIRWGAEAGEVLFNLTKMEKLLQADSYDVILLSLHRIQSQQDGFPTANLNEFTQAQRQDLLLEYFDQMLETIRWGQGDVVAHLTFPERYFKRYGLSIDFSEYSEYIDTLLKEIIHRGLGLEVNLSERRRESSIYMPGFDIVKRYAALGGEIVTLGSDAHAARDIGSKLADGIDLLKQAGVKYFAVYTERKPQFYTID